MEILLTLTSNIFQVESLKYKKDGFKDTLLLILQQKLLLLNGSNGSEISSYSINLKNIHIVDCIYSKRHQEFIIVTSNSSIIIIPEQSKNSSEFITFNFPIQPKKLYQLNNGNLVVICEDGWICKLSLENSLIQNIPTMKSKTQNNVNILSSTLFGNHIAFIVQQNNQLPVSTKKKAKKGATSTASTSTTTLNIPNTYVVIVDTNNILEQNWENILNESENTQKISLSIDTSFVPQLCSHGSTSAISVVYRDSSTSSSSTNTDYKWLKITISGEILFSLDITITNSPSIYLIGTENNLTIVTSSSIEVWNIHYGTQYTKNSLPLFKTPFNSIISPCFHLVSDDSFGLISGISEKIDNEDNNNNDNNNNNNTYSIHNTIVNVRDHPEYHSLFIDILNETELFDTSFSSTQNSLVSMIGHSKKRSLEIDSLLIPQATKTKRKNSLTEDSILNRIEETKRIILSKYVHDLIIDNLEVLQDCIITFLNVCESISLTDSKIESKLQIWNDNDWNVLEVLLKGQYVALTPYPNLFQFIIEATKISFEKRFPVIVAIAKFVIDLSEFQAVQLITLVAYYSSSSFDSNNNINNNNETTIAPTTPKGNKKSKKAKQNEAKELNSNSSTITNNNNNNNTSSLSTSLEKLSLVVELIVNRKFGFNSSVLSEFTSLFSLPLASILLRILGNMLRGLCNTDLSWNLNSSSTSSSSTTTPTTVVSDNNQFINILSSNDKDVKLSNIIQWIESILESHYKSFLFATMNLSKNSNDNNEKLESQPLQYVFKSLLCLHEVLNGIDDAIDLTELTSGITLHLRRVTKYQYRYQHHSNYKQQQQKHLQQKQLQQNQQNQNSTNKQQIIVQSKNKNNIIEYNENYQLEVVKF